jgi:hypothetical protein
MYLNKYLLRALYGKKQIILHIDPAKVKYHVGTGKPNAVGFRKKIGEIQRKSGLSRGWFRPILNIHHLFESFLIDRGDYQSPVNIESKEKYIKVKDFIENMDDLDKTLWRKNLLDELAESGLARHKNRIMHSEQEIDDFLNSYVKLLVESIKTDGYDISKDNEIGSVLVAQNGSLHKSGSGNHRFSIARELRIKSIPVVVKGIHADWYEEKIGQRLNIKALKNEIAKIEDAYS